MIVRVQSPVFLQMPAVYEFMKKAWAKPFNRKIEDLYAAILPVIDKPETGFFVGEENGQLKALGIVFLPTSALHNVPQVQWFWCHGSAALRDELVTALFDYVSRNGYNTCWVIFQRDAKAYERLMKKIGASKPIAQVYEVKVDASNLRRRK